jgi:hypothetical protein
VSAHAAPWRKSSFSSLGDCVALCRLKDGLIGIRNTNDPDVQVLVISTNDLADWLARIKTGAFDDLCQG